MQHGQNVLPAHNTRLRSRESVFVRPQRRDAIPFQIQACSPVAFWQNCIPAHRQTEYRLWHADPGSPPPYQYRPL